MQLSGVNLTPLSCVACMTICCSVHKSALTYKEIIFSTFSNHSVLCICICLISCTKSETYAHVGLRDGGPVFRGPPCILVQMQLSVHTFWRLKRRYTMKSHFLNVPTGAVKRGQQLTKHDAEYCKKSQLKLQTRYTGLLLTTNQQPVQRSNNKMPMSPSPSTFHRQPFH
jgi:hypothetical protein